MAAASASTSTPLPSARRTAFSSTVGENSTLEMSLPSAIASRSWSEKSTSRRT
jgi:hypothetical protein